MTRTNPLLVWSTVLNVDFKIDICATAKYLNNKNEYETLFYQNESTSKLLDIISNKERDVAHLLLTNKTSKEIAENLNISKYTDDTQRKIF
jgi:DNA-binding CsgD family transcriptional regulator